MKTLHKAIFFLGMVAVLLVLPMGVAAEDEEMQGPACVAIGTRGAAIAYSCSGAVQAQVQLTGTVVDAFRPVRVCEQVSSFVFQDGRSTLRFLCTLLC